MHLVISTISHWRFWFISDHSSSTFKWGRRRIFILVGALISMVGMVSIGCSIEIAQALGESKDGERVKDHPIGLSFAIIGLWIMNLFLNMMQGPARALVNDLVHTDDLQTANAIVTTVMAFSNIIANVSGAQLFRAGSITKEPYLILFNIGAGVLLLTTIPTLIFAKEERHIIKQGEKKKTVKDTFIDIYKGFRYMPRKLVIVIILFYLSWAAYAPTMVNLTTYFKENVFAGDEEGIEKGMYALAFFAAATFAYSLIGPSVIKCLGIKGAYLVTQVVATVLYALPPIMADWPYPVIVVVTSLVGPNFGTFHAIPFALVSSITAGQAEGLSMGLLNVAAVGSQTITNAIGSAIIGAVPKLPTGAQDVSWGIAFGAIFSFLAGIWCIIFIPNRTDPKDVQVIDENEPLIQKTNV